MALKSIGVFVDATSEGEKRAEEGFIQEYFAGFAHKPATTYGTVNAAVCERFAIVISMHPMTDEPAIVIEAARATLTALLARHLTVLLCGTA